MASNEVPNPGPAQVPVSSQHRWLSVQALGVDR